MPDQDGGHSRLIHASTNRLASACETPDMRNLRNLFFATPRHEKLPRGRPSSPVMANAAQINRVRPRASSIVKSSLTLTPTPRPQTQDVSSRLLELRLDERRLWVVGNRVLAVVVDVDGTYQVSLLVAGAVAQSWPDAPVAAETDALGARDLFRKGEIENRYWPLCRQ